MIVVSYATEDGRYDRFLRRLAESCDRVGLPRDFELIPPTTREEACRQKPGFLLKMLAKHDQPVVWLDADAMIVRPFGLPSFKWDIGLLPNTYRRWRKQYPMASFVVAAAPTDEAKRFLETWRHLCEWNGTPFGDHHRLHPTRLLQEGLYREMDLSLPLRGAIVRDAGLAKEAPVESDTAYWSRRILRGLISFHGLRARLRHLR